LLKKASGNNLKPVTYLSCQLKEHSGFGSSHYKKIRQYKLSILHKEKQEADQRE